MDQRAKFRPVWATLILGAMFCACPSPAPDPIDPAKPDSHIRTGPSAPEIIWGKPLYRLEGNKGAVALASDGEDNLALAGLAPPGPTGQSLLLTRHPKPGQMPWSQLFISHRWGPELDLAYDLEGDLILAASLEGITQLGSAGEIGQAGHWRLLLAKFSGRDGKLLWKHTYALAGTGVWPHLAVGPAKQITLAGTFQGRIDLDRGQLTADPEGDCFLARFKADGQQLWGTKIGGQGRQTITTLRADHKGRLIIALSFESDLELLPKPPAGDSAPSSALAIMGPKGQALLTIPLEGENSSISDLASAGDTIYLSGAYRRQLKIGQGRIESPGPDERCFLTRITPAGKISWLRTIGESSGIRCTAIGAGRHGQVWLAGSVAPKSRLGGREVATKGPYGLLLSKMDGRTGALLQTITIGDSSKVDNKSSARVGVSHLLVESDGDLVLSADFAGSVPLGGERWYHGPPSAFLFKVRSGKTNN